MKLTGGNKVGNVNFNSGLTTSSVSVTSILTTPASTLSGGTVSQTVGQIGYTYFQLRAIAGASSGSISISISNADYNTIIISTRVYIVNCTMKFYSINSTAINLTGWQFGISNSWYFLYIIVVIIHFKVLMH